MSVDKEYSFNGFLTQNTSFQENFSIGLIFNPKDEKGTIVLLRVNGQHGGTIQYPHHAVCHIHKATAENINSGKKPEGHIELTTEYSTMESAIQFYCKIIGLMTYDIRKHFPTPTGMQTDLFEGLI